MLRVVRDAVESLGTIIALSAVCFRGASRLTPTLERNVQMKRQPSSLFESFEDISDSVPVLALGRSNK